MADIFLTLTLLSFSVLFLSLLFASLKLVKQPSLLKKMNDILGFPAKYIFERGRFEKIILAIIINFIFTHPRKFKKIAADLFVMNIIAKVSILTITLSMLAYGVMQ